MFPFDRYIHDDGLHLGSVIMVLPAEIYGERWVCLWCLVDGGEATKMKKREKSDEERRDEKDESENKRGEDRGL